MYLKYTTAAQEFKVIVSLWAWWTSGVAGLPERSYRYGCWKVPWWGLGCSWACWNLDKPQLESHPPEDVLSGENAELSWLWEQAEVLQMKVTLCICRYLLQGFLPFDPFSFSNRTQGADWCMRCSPPCPLETKSHIKQEIYELLAIDASYSVNTFKMMKDKQLTSMAMQAGGKLPVDRSRTCISG